MSIQKVIKVGHSLAVTLPSLFTQTVSIKKGDRVEVQQQLDNTLTLKFPDQNQLSLNLEKHPL